MFSRCGLSLVFSLVPLLFLPASSFAEELPETPAPAEMPADPAREFQEQISAIDSRLAVLEQEQTALMEQARETHRSQFEIHRQIVASNAVMQDLEQRIEAAQRELQALQESLAQQLAADPGYTAFQEQQAGVSGRIGTIQREIMTLANDRVRKQLELQALEQPPDGVAAGNDFTSGAAAPDPEETGTALPAEDSEQ